MGGGAERDIKQDPLIFLNEIKIKKPFKIVKHFWNPCAKFTKSVSISF